MPEDRIERTWTVRFRGANPVAAVVVKVESKGTMESAIEKGRRAVPNGDKAEVAECVYNETHYGPIVIKERDRKRRGDE